MKYVAITMMQQFEHSRQEWRDTLDQRWLALIQACGMIPLYLPNNADIAENMLLRLNPAGVIFSGGGDPFAISGKRDERDLTEARVLEWALKFSKSVYGVCRGMQVVLSHFGSSVEPVTGHVAVRHHIYFNQGERDVNSFHNYGFRTIPKTFTATSWSQEGEIESAVHQELRISLVMWHPEREKDFSLQDIRMIMETFGVE